MSGAATSMHICQIFCGTGYAGLERHCVTLSNQLAARGHRVTLIAHPEYAPYLAPKVAHEALDLGGWRLNPALLWKLARVLRRLQPDLVHAHANKAAAMLATLAPFVAAKRVATIHSLKSRTSMFQGFDGLIAVSQGVAQQLRHPCLRVIHNGIPPADYAPPAADYTAQQLHRPVQRPLVLAVGRLVQVKGFDVLIEAWRDIDATLVIAGEGTERANLEQLIKRHGLEGRVHLAGLRNDIPALLADADLFVLSSRREGFPYVMVEALQARKLIVATRVPGTAEFLPPGYIVECENPKALADCVRSALANPDAARQAFAPAWDYAATELTLEHMVERTEDFYRRVLGQ